MPTLRKRNITAAKEICSTFFKLNIFFFGVELLAKCKYFGVTLREISLSSFSVINPLMPADTLA
jgi:hypothetical protein